MNKIFVGPILLLIAVLLSSCTIPGDPLFDQKDIQEINEDEPIDFATQVMPIFESSCLNCHGSFALGGLSLESFNDLIVGGDNVAAGTATMVVPCDPDSSFLYDKVVTDTPSAGSRMPQGGKLADVEIEIIRLWIEQGASETPDSSLCGN